ncbi:hypothetical protein D3C76_924020 [compost metagenome]
MSQFDELLAQLTAAEEEQSTLAKALPEADGEDDKTIQTAADEGAEGEENPEDEEDEDAGETPMTKSMVVDGEEVEVVDAEALIKSVQDLGGRMGKAEEVLAKGLASALGLIKGQGDLIKSLQDQVKQLGGKGAGRKTVLTVHEKPAATSETLAKSQQDEGLTKDQFLAKSEAAWTAGVISGVEFSSVDVALRTGNKLDSGLISRIVNHK